MIEGWLLDVHENEANTGMVAWVVGGIAAAALAVVKGRSVIMPWYNIRVAKQF